MQQVIIKIATDGSVKIDAQGFQGKGCAAATEQLELILGGGPGSVKKNPKPEMFAPAVTGQSTTTRTF